MKLTINTNLLVIRHAKLKLMENKYLEPTTYTIRLKMAYD